MIAAGLGWFVRDGQLRAKVTALDGQAIEWRGRAETLKSYLTKRRCEVEWRGGAWLNCPETWAASYYEDEAVTLSPFQPIHAGRGSVD